LPGARGILKFLKGKGHKLAIASNRPTKFTLIILKVLGILQLFDVVLCADKAGKPKPYPDILWAIARRLCIEKPEILYVGDMTIDVECAHRAGVRMVAVATGSSSIKELKELKPWRIIGKMDQLKKIMTWWKLWPKKSSAKKGIRKLSKRLRKGKLNWRSKKANHGAKPGKGWYTFPAAVQKSV
jgi:phosphoglycolate phosphatase-like HAD superfamily hydrolase